MRLRTLAPRQTYFTHMSHELEHEATNAALPAGMALAYDGQRIAPHVSRTFDRVYFMEYNLYS